MKPHKWHKEIKHFIDGGEVEYSDINNEQWLLLKDIYQFGLDYKKFRIKPQPKEPQYLYVWIPHDEEGEAVITHQKPKGVLSDSVYKYVGKIKLEQDDEG